jgi:hypothetical protein
LNKTSSGPLEATSRNSGLGVTPAQPHPTRAASHEKPHSKVQREIKRKRERERERERERFIRNYP